MIGKSLIFKIVATKKNNTTFYKYGKAENQNNKNRTNAYFWFLAYIFLS